MPIVLIALLPLGFIAIALQRCQPRNHPNSALCTKNNLVLNTNILVDSLRHSNIFAKTYCKFMIIQIYKLMRGNLTLRAELVPSVVLERTFLGRLKSFTILDLNSL